MKTWILGLALVSGCGATSSNPQEMAGSTTDVPATTASSSSSSGASTGDEPGSTSNPGTSSSSGEADTGTDTDLPDLEPGPVECESTSCGVSCGHAEYQYEDDGEVCGCESSDDPDGIIACRLPLPCESSNDPLRCVLQALRYDIPGAYELEDDEGTGDFSLSRYEVFGAGLTRASWRGGSEGCCTGAGSTFSGYLFPQSTPPADDPFWDECEPELWGVASCFRRDALFPDLNCQPMLEVCPEPVELGETCEESCPMAGDGICDEAAGTGLCATGCDPDDCA